MEPRFILTLILMLVLLVPAWLTRRSHGRRKQRLAELEAGAPEAYFEERRDNENDPRGPYGWITWISALVLLVIGLAALAFREWLCRRHWQSA
jgi:hypothetical protein